jgi:hypothetical protein
MSSSCGCAYQAVAVAAPEMKKNLARLCKLRTGDHADILDRITQCHSSSCKNISRCVCQSIAGSKYRAFVQSKVRRLGIPSCFLRAHNDSLQVQESTGGSHSRGCLIVIADGTRSQAIDLQPPALLALTRLARPPLQRARAACSLQR